MKAIWPRASVAIPRMRFRVVCGLAETIEIFWPTRAFRRVDFPELGRPIIAAVPYFIETNDTRKADRPSRKRIYSPDCAAAVDLFLTDIA